MQKTSVANNENLNINLENIVGTNGLTPNTQFTLKISYGKDENNQLVANQIFLNTPTTKNPNNNSLAIGLGVGLWLGIPILAVSSYFLYWIITKRKKQ